MCSARSLMSIVLIMTIIAGCTPQEASLLATPTNPATAIPAMPVRRAITELREVRLVNYNAEPVWSTDSQLLIASDDQDRTLKVIDSHTGELRASMYLEFITGIAASPDNRLLAVITDRTTLYIIDLPYLLAQGQMDDTQVQSAVNSGHIATGTGYTDIETLVFSTDGQSLLLSDAVYDPGFPVTGFTVVDLHPAIADLTLDFGSGPFINLTETLNTITPIRRIRTFDYEGEPCEIYEVEQDGITHEWALVRPRRATSSFVDPQNPAAGIIEWEGNWRELEPVWDMPPAQGVYQTWRHVIVPYIGTVNNQFVVLAVDPQVEQNTLMVITPGDAPDISFEPTSQSLQGLIISVSPDLNKALVLQSTPEDTDLRVLSLRSSETKDITKLMEGADAWFTSRAFTATFHPDSDLFAFWSPVRNRGMGLYRELHLGTTSEGEVSQAFLMLTSSPQYAPSLLAFSPDGSQLAITLSNTIAIVAISDLEDEQLVPIWTQLTEADPDRIDPFDLNMLGLKYPPELVPIRGAQLDNRLPGRHSLELVSPGLGETEPFLGNSLEDAEAIPAGQYRLQVRLSDAAALGFNEVTPDAIIAELTAINASQPAERQMEIVSGEAITIGEYPAVSFIMRYRNFDVLSIIVEAGTNNGRTLYGSLTLLTQSGDIENYTPMALEVAASFRFAPVHPSGSVDNSQHMTDTCRLLSIEQGTVSGIERCCMVF